MLDLLQYPFFRNALLGIFIISIPAAIIGAYIISRRLVAISGGITHACFGGLGLGYYLGLSPMAMATVFAVASALGVEWMSARQRVREDSAIAVIWALGMALGVLLVFMTPGYVPELNSFLFGNILTISSADLITFAIYTAVLIVVFALWGRTIVICAFDSDYARVAGLPVTAVSRLMTVMIALCIVLTIRLVGIMLLMSMIALPAMIAETFVTRYRPITLWAVVISIVTGTGGLLLSAFVDVPCSAIIVIIQVSLYAASKAIKPLFNTLNIR